MPGGRKGEESMSRKWTVSRSMEGRRWPDLPNLHQASETNTHSKYREISKYSV